MTARPYNHPDNLDLSGQPKVSEDAWANQEALRDSNFSSRDLMRALESKLDAKDISSSKDRRSRSEVS